MSNRVNPVEVESAQGQVKEQFNAFKSKFGMIPNTLKIMAHSPATLESFAFMGGALAKGVLPRATRDAIALAVSQYNGCEYCVSAHTLTGKLAGLTQEQTLDARRGKSSDPKLQAILNLATNIVERRGNLSDDQLNDARKAGVSDAEIVEVVGNVTSTILTNYLNNVAHAEIDFPKVSLTL